MYARRATLPGGSSYDCATARGRKAMLNTSADTVVAKHIDLLVIVIAEVIEAPRPKGFL
jgi:hypothetical protein